MPEVRVKSLKKKFGNSLALDEISFTAEEEKFTTILGPSGSGKTTVLRCIAGLEDADEGEIWIGNNLVYSSTGGIIVQPEDRGIGMVFQSYAIWPHMTVFDNIAYPLNIRGLNRRDTEDKVKKILDLVGLQGLEKRPAPNLSGGQQQRVALARALVYEPKVLLLDEQLSNLDTRLRERMRTELKELQRNIKITTIYVTHDRLEAMSLSDKLILMRRGIVAASGNPDTLYSNPPNRFVAGFLCRMNVVKGIQTSTQKELMTLIETSIGHLYCKVPEILKDDKEVMISLRRNSIKMSREQRDEVNVVSGLVKNRLFEGDYVEYLVKICDELIKVRENTENIFQEDEKVFLTIKPEDCIVIKSEEYPTLE